MQTITDDIDFLSFIGNQESQYIIKPSTLADKVRDRLNGVRGEVGDLLPWSKTHKYVELRPGGVSVWAGVNGHGKSQLLGQVCAWSLRKSKWLIASLEMPPEATMERMLKQTSGTGNPSDEFQCRILNWTDDRLWIYDQTDTVEAKRILGMAHYAGKELGVNHLVIDSLMKCGIKKDDLNGQTEFVDRLCWAARATGTHIHLVHHMRKGDKEGRIPDKFDIRGAGEITDLVDNVFIVHRNKDKEERVRQGKHPSEDEQDCTLIVAKQRHGEWEGMFKLWFHPESKQYVPSNNSKLMDFSI